MITLQQLKSVCPMADANLHKALIDCMNKCQINTVERESMFLAQLMHESNMFKATSENLNYGADGLMKTFGRYYPSRLLAESHARKPELIASTVYANRMGNGAPETKDGWKYRGRGYIQITGKNNYTALSKFCGVDVLTDPDKVSQLPLSVMSAGWFWTANKLNNFCDKGDLKGLTRAINGGFIGLDHRTKLYEQIKRLIS